MSLEDSEGGDDTGRKPPSRFTNPWFLAAVAGLILIPAIRPLFRFEPEPPPVLRPAPEWRLVDQDGRPLGSAELAGEAYVASFVFTRCAVVCPGLTARLAGLERRYREEGVSDVRLVSFSVDPAYDTPEQLRSYALGHRLDLERWSLVTGPEEEVRSLIEDGFALWMGERIDLAGGLVDVSHSTRLVLVDRDGGIRGDYGSDAVGLNELFHRTRQVLAD